MNRKGGGRQRPALGIKAAVFDMDGTLTDSEPLINASAISMLREYGVEARPEDFIPFIGTGEDRYLGGVAEKYGLRLDLKEAKRRTYEIYLEMVPTRLKAYPGVNEIFFACRNAGLRMAVASSADLIKIVANLEHIGIPPAKWDAVVTAEDVERKKPDPAIFLAAARRLGLEPGQCAAVEDSPSGIEAATRAGMRCVAVAQTHDGSFLGKAHLVRPSLRDVSVQDLLGI